MTDVYGVTIPTVGGSSDTWGTSLNNTLIAAPTFTDRLQGTWAINSPTDSQAEYLVLNARFPFDVKRATYVCLPTGTATLAFKIDGTNIGGLSALSATSTQQTTDASSANSVAAGEDVTLVATSISAGVERIIVALWGDRTDAGTAV